MNKLFEKMKFSDKGLIPAIIQDDSTKEVLTLCYMNQDAIAKTLETGKVHVFRRSKGKLMMKGETSGCTQAVKSLAIDCEGNSLLFKVGQERAACHTGYFSCYFQELDKDGNVTIKAKRVFDPDEVYKK
jgi:phosphoribosyl-AMP cyclohydrolase